MMYEHLMRLWADPTTQRLGWALLHFIWQGAAIAALLAVVLWTLRSASARYIAACGAMLLMAACPVLTFITLTPVASELSKANGMFNVADITSGTRSFEHSATDARVPSQTAAHVVTSVGETQWTPNARQALPWLVAIWSVGVIVMSIRLAGGWWRVTVLRRRGRLLGEALCVRATNVGARMGVSRVCPLVESAVLASPAVIGWLRPVILLPTSALTGLSAAQLDAMLAHEFAHIRRHDYLVNLIQSAIEVVLFYHPAVWWVSRRIRIERENACDDLAAEVCGDRIVYVEALAAMETLRQSAITGITPALALAAAGSGDASLLSRVRRLLGVPTPRSRDMRRFGLLPAITSVMVIALIMTKTTAADPKPQNESIATTTAPASSPTTQLTVKKPAGEYFVGGEVAAAGAYSMSGSDITLLQALIAARADMESTPLRHVLLRRATDKGDEELQGFDLTELLENPKLNIPIKPGDTLIVRAGPLALRKFVRVVVGPETYAFQGQTMRPEEILLKLAGIADPANTALELGYSSEEITLKEWTHAQGWAASVVKAHGLRHLSIVGLQNAESKGSPAEIDQSPAKKNATGDALIQRQLDNAYRRSEQVVASIRQRKNLAVRDAAIEQTREHIAEGSPEEKLMALAVVAQIYDVPFEREGMRKAVLGALKDNDASIRAAALRGLLAVKPDASALPQIAPLAGDVDPVVRAKVSTALFAAEGDKQPELVHPIIDKLLVDEDAEVKKETVRSLWGHAVSPKAEAILIEMSRAAGGTSGLPYDALYYALSTRPVVSLPVAERLIEILPDPDGINRAGRAAWGLSHHQVSEEARDVVLAAFIRTLDETLQPYVRSNCVYGLGALGGEAAVKKLKEIVGDEAESTQLRAEAQEALQRARG